MLTTGDELANAASQALGTDLKFEDISEYVPTLLFNVGCGVQADSPRAEAKKVLHAQSQSDQSELQYLLEYYSLVREGKTNYISTTAFHDVTGGHPQEPVQFFKVYAESFHPKQANGNKKRKVSK